MDEETRNVEILAERALTQRGLTRAPGPLAFVYAGQQVQVTVDKSLYRGHFITVHDGHRPARQFRATAGGYDWNMIAAHIIEIAKQRIEPVACTPKPAQIKDQNRQLADELSTITGMGPDSRLSIQPSPNAPGCVRVRLDEIDLDPVSVIQLYTAVAGALPKKPNSKR